MSFSDEYNQDIINKVLPQIIKKIGIDLGVPVIDIFNALGGADLKYNSYFYDSIHPNE